MRFCLYIPAIPEPRGTVVANGWCITPENDMLQKQNNDYILWLFQETPDHREIQVYHVVFGLLVNLYGQMQLLIHVSKWTCA